MQFYNPQYNANGTIDSEIDHPDFGRIPFTADPNDTGAQFDVAAMFAAMVADPTTLKYVAPPPAPITSADVNAERTRRLEGGHAFAVAGLADPIPLQGRQQDQIVYASLLMRAQGYAAAGITAPSIVMRDAADVNQLLTPEQATSLISQGMDWFQSVMQVSWDMKDAVGVFPDGIPADYTDDRHWP